MELSAYFHIECGTIKDRNTVEIVSKHGLDIKLEIQACTYSHVDAHRTNCYTSGNMHIHPHNSLMSLQGDG